MYDGWLKIDFASMSEKLVHLQKKGTPYIFEAEWVPRGDKKVYQSTALFSIKGENKGEVAIARRGFRRRLSARQVFSGDAGRRH